MGRPSKLTRELRDELCKHLEAGHFLGTAADLCGVGRSTVHRWMALGEEQGADPEYREFREAVTRARARASVDLESAAFADAMGGTLVREVIRPDGTRESAWTPPNGRVALELLARMHPEEWRPVKAVEVSGHQGGPIEVGNNAAVVESLVKRIAEVRKRRQAQSNPREQPANGLGAGHPGGSGPAAGGHGRAAEPIGKNTMAGASPATRPVKRVNAN
ncbi:hypothetical protein [Nonomuraea sp. B19D2]|uniref:hypothetical protein n=1 Tax=Nonomuraea sp. B19D2 TaxID=3159561 RepID=UPI0032DB6030